MTDVKRLLAANRSEIAIRIFRSAHELGIRTRTAMRWIGSRRTRSVSPASRSKRTSILTRLSRWQRSMTSTRFIRVTDLCQRIRLSRRRVPMLELCLSGRRSRHFTSWVTNLCTQNRRTSRCARAGWWQLTNSTTRVSHDSRFSVRSRTLSS